MPRLIEPGRHAWRFHDVDQVGLLIDAEDYYREFYRAALTARRRLLISGWQFDSDVALLRGQDAEQAPAPVEFLKFLNHLCENAPELEIRILAWDFHVVFAIEREWMQKLVFHWSTHERIEFKFDASHVENGSHHQKFVVVDDKLSFLGGLDICDHRWDTTQHKNKNPLRMSRGEPHKPFHDIQAYFRGSEITRSLTDLFHDRWQRAGGDPLNLDDIAGEEQPPFEVHGLLPLAATRLSLNRTDPHGSPDGPKPCTEIRDLHVDVLQAAERLIYIETQYFSSHVIAEALERRMRSEGRPHLEIVLVLNMKAETLKEQAAVGLSQAKQIARVRKVAAETGHALGIYYSLPACDADEQPEQATYIHSKLMAVDDRILTVGSANLTNRSLSVDTELNATFEADSADDAVAASIRHARAVLLGEHTGGPEIDRVEGLVAHLDDLANRADAGESGCPCRLRHHPSPTEGERTALEIIDPSALPFDPDSEDHADEDRSIFVGGMGSALRHLLGVVTEKM
jgi:phosphatidylserine/phosphatidylglycerophosphate/cardiolipin synthase-like enzyme